MRAVLSIMLVLVAGCKEKEVPFEHSYSQHLNGSTASERVKTILPLFERSGISGLMLDDAQFISDSFAKGSTGIEMNQVYLAVRPQPESLKKLRRIGEKSSSDVGFDYQSPLSHESWWIDSLAFRKLTTILPMQLAEGDGWMAIDKRTGWLYIYNETRTN